MNLNATRPWVIGGVLIALIMAAVTWLMVIGPTRSDASTLREDTASVQTQNDVLASRVVSLEQQAAGRADLEAGARAALSALPAEVSLPDLNQELGLHAQSRGVEITSISVAAATAATDTGTAAEATSPDLLKVPITIETSGSRLAQMYFLRDLQEVGPRAALVTSTSMTADGADLFEDPIQTTLTTQFSVFAHALSERDSELLAGVVDSASDSD